MTVLMTIVNGNMTVVVTVVKTSTPPRQLLYIYLVFTQFWLSLVRNGVRIGNFNLYFCLMKTLLFNIYDFSTGNVSFAVSKVMAPSNAWITYWPPIWLRWYRQSDACVDWSSHPRRCSCYTTKWTIFPRNMSALIAIRLLANDQMLLII